MAKSSDNRELVDYLIEGNKNCKNLIEAQQKYIEFLGKEILNYATTSKYKISEVAFHYGQQLRDQIEEMSAFLEK